MPRKRARPWEAQGHDLVEVAERSGDSDLTTYVVAPTLLPGQLSPVAKDGRVLTVEEPESHEPDDESATPSPRVYASEAGASSQATEGGLFEVGGAEDPTTMQIRPPRDITWDKGASSQAGRMAAKLGLDLRTYETTLLFMSAKLEHGMTLSAMETIGLLMNASSSGAPPTSVVLHNRLREEYLSIYRLTSYHICTKMGHNGQIFPPDTSCVNCLAIGLDTTRLRKSTSESPASGLKIAIRPQLQAIIERNFATIMSLHECRHTRPAEEWPTDTRAGARFGRSMETGLDFLARRVVRLQFVLNTDGVNMEPQMSGSMWPYYLCLWDLPPNLRYSPANRIVAGVCSCPATSGCSPELLDTVSGIVLEEWAIATTTPLKIQYAGTQWKVVCSITLGVLDAEAIKKLYRVPSWASIGGFCPVCRLVVVDQSGAEVSLVKRELNRTTYGLKSGIVRGSPEEGSLGGELLAKTSFQSLLPMGGLVFDMLHTSMLGFFKRIDRVLRGHTEFGLTGLTPSQRHRFDGLDSRTLLPTYYPTALRPLSYPEKNAKESYLEPPHHSPRHQFSPKAPNVAFSGMGSNYTDTMPSPRMYIESQPNWESQHFGRTRNRSSDPIVDQVESAVQRSDYTDIPDTAAVGLLRTREVPKPVRIAGIAFELKLADALRRISDLEQRREEDADLIISLRDEIASLKSGNYRKRAPPIEQDAFLTCSIRLGLTPKKWEDLCWSPASDKLRSFNFALCVSKAINLHRASSSSAAGHFKEQLHEMAAYSIKLIIPPGVKNVFLASSDGDVEKNKDHIYIHPSEGARLTELAMYFIECQAEHWGALAQQFHINILASLNNARRTDRKYAFIDAAAVEVEHQRIRHWYERQRPSYTPKILKPDFD